MNIDDIMGIYNNSTIQNAVKIQNNINKLMQIYDNIFESQQKLAKIMEGAIIPLMHNDAVVRIDEMLNGSIRKLNHIYDNLRVCSIYPKDTTDEEAEEIETVNEKIIAEIITPDTEKKIIQTESPIITLSPVNDRVLKYLFENPQALYQLTSREFEKVMAEIYHKLGYDVELTPATRDGGKDIILTKFSDLGDFIYYVECKKYEKKNHVGVGVVRNLHDTINLDRVNGGIIATTSFFTRDGRKFILDNNLGCQIKLHDYNKIQQLLNKVV